MTEAQWEEIGGLADQCHVDWSDEANHDIEGWTKKVKELGYISEKEVQQIFGGWEELFWEACEWA